MYVQYGAGLQYIQGWINYDASPRLIFEKIWLYRLILNNYSKCIFDPQILYGDIVKGLPHANKSVDGVFCSHVLEHLSLDDFHKAISNTFNMLKDGGRFRLIVPNLTYYVENYLDFYHSPKSIEMTRAYKFNVETCYGRQSSRSSILKRLIEAFGNSNHLWMWDIESLKIALEGAGFQGISEFKKGECSDGAFLAPERDYQFMNNAISLECFRPK